MTEQQKEGKADAGPVSVVTLTLKNGKTRICNLVTKEKAVEEAESGFGAWDIAGKLLYVGHVCWLLKEIFWLLLLSVPAFIAGGAALILITISMIRRWDGGTGGKLYKEVPAELLIGITHIGWLFWNCFAMIITFSYGEPEETPGYAKGLVNLLNCDGSGSCKDDFETLLTINRVGFALVFCVWLGSCGYLLYLWLTPPRFIAQGHAFQTVVLEGGWIAFWVLKDFAWTYEEDGFAAALVAYGIHFIFLVVGLIASSSKTLLWDGIDADEMERIGANMTRVDLPTLSYVLWSLSSLLWLLMEEAFDESLGMRYAATAMCCLSLVLFLVSYKQARQRGKAISLMTRELKELDSASLKAAEAAPAVVGAEG